MSPSERAALVAAVLADPEALWAVRKARVRVLGPWVPARSERRRIGIGGDASWRLSTKGEDVACVHRWWKMCDGVEEPRVHDYHLGDEDEYEAAKAAYEAAVAVRAGREWVYRIDGEKTQYAVSEEEAKTLADEVLRARGFLLLDVLDEKQMRRYRS